MDTFQALYDWIAECKANDIDFSKVPAIIVGNKCDLARANPDASNNNGVDEKIAKLFAKTLDFPLIITSAKDDSMKSQVEEIFNTLARKIVLKHALNLYFDDSVGTIDLRKNSKKADKKRCMCN